MNGFRRDKIAAEREYKKKKAQKKAQRHKQLEEERESEKNKWLDFNAKVLLVGSVLLLESLGQFGKVAFLEILICEWLYLKIIIA